MSTHLKYACFVLFLLLFVSCNASSKKKTGDGQTTEQAPQTADNSSTESALIPDFAMIDLTGTRLLGGTDEVTAKRYTHCIYRGKVFPIKFEKEQEKSPDYHQKWHEREYNYCFDDLGGSVYSVTEGCLLSQEELEEGWFCDALLVDENYLKDLEIIPITEVYNSADGDDSYEYYESNRSWCDSSLKKEYDPVPVNIAYYYTTQFNRLLEGCFIIAKAGDIVFYKVLFIDDEGNHHLAIVMDDGNQVVGENSGEVYFAGGGEFSISCISMLMKKNGTYQMIKDAFGSEMMNTYLLEVSGNELKTTGISNYRYTAPM